MDTAGRELKEKVVSAGPIPEKAAGEVERH